MDYRRTTIAQDESVAASSVTTYDLPVNPVSHLVLTLKGLNVTDEATLAQILARLSNVTVSRFGANIINLSGADLHALNGVMFGNMPILTNQVATDNATRAISFIIPFGRKLYDPNECLPETLRGELRMSVTMSATETELDGMILQIEAVELIGAKPKSHLKVTTISLTPTSGVDNDVDLPVGNKFAGILLFSTTVPTGTVWTTTIDRIKLLVDGVEKEIANANWEALHGELLSRVGQKQQYDASANDDDLTLYALADFSPHGEDTFLVDTKDRRQAILRITAGDASALRALPIEVVGI